MLKSASKWGKYHTKYHTKSHDKTVLLRKGFLNPRTLFIDDIFINSFKDRAAWLPSADDFNVAIRNSIGMHLGCCVMPQVVEPERWEPRSTKRLPEALVQLIGV